MLNELNRFDRRGDVLVHDQAGDFNYSDGSDVEQYLKAVLERAEDLSSCSVELEAAIRDWATEYHLSSKRANLLRGFDFPAGGRVLELGCGCGAVTRYLGEQGLAVDAVEGSPVRAELAALRCRGLDDVSVYCANFNDITLPDGHYDLVCLVGVAEYAARFMTGHGDADPVVSLLTRLKASLSPTGVILVAIENRTGMKYVLGAHEDHYARRFVGINNYFGVKDINTYTLPEWERILDAVGIGDRLVYLPFPDYKLPTAILSRPFAAENTEAYCNLEGVQSRDYVDIYRPPVRESLLWQSAAASGSLDLYANSFLFVLSGNDTGIDPAYRFDFAHLPGFSRRREFCLRAVKPEGEPVVRRRKLIQREADDDLVRQRVVDEPYHAGTLLSVSWARALEIEPDSDRFAGLVTQYLAFLEEQEELSIDLTPSNIIVDADGGLRPFDEEWLTSIELSKEFLLFRSVLILMISAGAAARPYARRHRLETVRDLVVHVGGLAGLDLETGMEDLIHREEAYQRAIAVERSGNPTRKLLSRSIGEDSRYVAPVKARLYWRAGAKPFVEERSRHVFVDNADDEQLVRIGLPPDAGTADWIRFNPCERVEDGAGFMRIRRMEIALVDPDSGDRSPVWQVEDPAGIARDGRLSGIRYAESGHGEMFMVTADDPAIELRFIPRRRLPAGHYLEFTAAMTLPRSSDYLLAWERYLRTQERMEKRLTELDGLEAAHARLQEELAAIKRSGVWRTLHHYRSVRAGLDRMTGKLQLWRGVYRNLGFGPTVRRAWRQGSKQAARMTGRGDGALDPPTRYETWRDLHLRRGSQKPPDGPLISVIMPVYNAPADILNEAVSSVRKQTYRNWELCIADDASTSEDTLRVLSELDDERIKQVTLPENRNISGATNAATELAGGRYLAFMDNDDVLSADALAEVAAVIGDTGADFIYTDEDFIRIDGHLDNPHFKPDYNPDLLLSHNYITHLLVLERNLFKRAGRLRPEYDGAQDYDLALRAVEQAKRIVHVPKPLYHWRMSETSTSVNPTIKAGGNDNARKAVEDTLRRRSIDGTVEETDLPHYFRVRRRIAGAPLVDIIIPFRDKPDLLGRCVTSILERSTWSGFRILGVSNDSRESSTHDEMDRLRALDDRVAFCELNCDFNFSRLVNHGVSRAGGDHVLLLNNDIEIISPEWIEALLEHSQRPEVAAVGGKLYYPNNTIQHAGIAIGLGGYAGHLHQRARASSPGYFNRLNVIQNVSAVTGAMMMVQRQKYVGIGMFDETHFGVAYNDVDFCLRAREHDYLNVFTPYAEAYHFESRTRGYEDTPEKTARFNRDKENLLRRHGPAIERGDPYYNSNFDRNRDDFRLPSEPASVARG